MSAAYRSPLLSLPGAAELPDAATSPLDAAGVAWHYGDPLGEQRLAETTPVMVDRSHRGVILVGGTDAPAFLNNLLSQKLVDLPAPYSSAALDLDIQGHILHHVDVYFDGSTFYLDCPSDQAESLVEFLRTMVFWSKVQIDVADVGILTVFSPTPDPDALRAVSGAASTRFVRHVDSWPSGHRYDVCVERSALRQAAEAFTASGGAYAGLMMFTDQRVRAGEPELGVDLDDKSIPHEVPRFIARGERAGAVHLDKGCYRGQETVARVENLGRSPRLLVLLQLDGSAPVDPVPGADIVVAGGRKVGRLGTVVHDADYGPIALALIKRSALNGADVTIVAEGEVAARVDPDSLPADEGEKAGRRAVEKLRGSQ
ncbi:tRNA-modifying protein YgfZ [Corynebacterium capitovis DSM 44611]|uniref:CAF17-like 4Fe-4S cluster assembly/insertion protein YgfZ n=1 Tax=Corynebacterium capitovis TaxID=131081 RepID=UPI00036459EE|nr:folate-binding protein YgfZ [Corynebacterium capitovis]WKD58104.1 tRNA-modifying protein YgfZ [Corynebacterium capitovis DSM 44611]